MQGAFAWSAAIAGRKAAPLDELHVTGFDGDGIWQQIEMQLQRLTPALKRQVQNATQISASETQREQAGAASNRAMQPARQARARVARPDSDEDSQLDSDEESADGAQQARLAEREYGSSDEDGAEDEAALPPRLRPGSGPSAPVDDQFFRLADMEHFADAMEDAMGMNDTGDEDDDQQAGTGSSRAAAASAALGLGGDVDYFARLSDDSDSDDGGREATYADFFGGPKHKTKASAGHVRFAAEEDEDSEEGLGAAGLAPDSDDEEAENYADALIDSRAQPGAGLWDSDEDGSDEASLGAALTSHQQRQADLAREIQALEDAAVSQKSWELQGEVKSRARPENSLLAATVDAEYGRKLRPEVTVEASAALEDMIKQRIRDEAWDDPVARAPPADGAEAERELPELSTTRPDGGLGEVYAEEYKRRAMGIEGDNPYADAEAEVERMWSRLSAKLDSLAHMSYKPAAPARDIAVDAKPGVPALTVEEVVPMAVSTADMAAPAEVHAPSRGRAGMHRAAAELDPAASKAARRASKAAHKRAAAHKAAEQAARANAGIGPGARVRSAAQELASATNKLRAAGSSVTIATPEAGRRQDVKSGQFFAALQASVAQDIASKAGQASAGKKRRRGGSSSAALKM